MPYNLILEVPLREKIFLIKGFLIVPLR
ncbi:hypothetical protein MY3296_002490 [Beauveria thailandica]